MQLYFHLTQELKRRFSKTLDILIKAAERVGLPEGALAYLHIVTPSGSLELMNHRDTSLIMNTGVPGNA